MRGSAAQVIPGFGPPPGSDLSSPPPYKGKARRRFLRARYGVGLLVLVALGGGLMWEERSSALQAQLLAHMADGMSFQVRGGPTSRPHFPIAGPYDERLGYTEIPKFIDRLSHEGFAVTRQAQITPEMEQFVAQGGYAVYREKTQAGLKVLDRNGAALFAKSYPDAAYGDFNSVPPLVVSALLFIEDRELLNPDYPQKYPAVDWQRFALAAATRLAGVDGAGPVRGGASTLATQLEKFRHSPGGRTGSSADKLKQMATASLRAYLNGPDSTKACQRIVVDYLNSTPLGSRSGYGEINGVADGLKVWYGTSFAEANKVLADSRLKGGVKQAQVYKQVLSLFLAQRRPAFYLHDMAELDSLANTYLALLEQGGYITADLARAARSYQLKLSGEAPVPVTPSFAERKAVDAIRSDLLTTLDTQGLSSLDRLDLTVHSTIDQTAQANVTRALKSLGNADGAKAMGIVGPNMLGGEDPSRVIYSVVLYERGEDHHAVRVHADSLDAPFDINSGAKLILGSTAKLRTVATYLNVVYDLHQKYHALSPKDLRAAAGAARDPLTIWATDYLSGASDRSLKAMLDAAMQRRYSASPFEGFFTGGGLHHFANFNKDDDSSVPNVEEALRHSINLPMVRLMRDVVRYYAAADEAADSTTPESGREAYLRRFADKEGREYLSRFYGDYHGHSPNEILALLAGRAKPAPNSLATLFLALRPKATPAELAAFLQNHTARAVDENELLKLYSAFGPGHYSLTDSAFMAGVHPLELWLAGYLAKDPQAARGAMMTASAEVRQEVYQWLFKTKSRHKQDARIRILREEDAFKRVLEEWRGQGYPFNQIIPSYATALGSSGDRPEALGRLMGIILNNGIDVPIATVERMTFAAATPYETELAYAPQHRPVRVFAAEVAARLRKALQGVVDEGTAIRLHNAFVDANNAPIPIGGKTGTGDNRFKTFDTHGDVIDSRSVDRTATFAFFVGEKLFGTITAYVPGPYSENYTFTSSIVVQLLKSLSPDVQKLMRETPPRIVALGAEPAVFKPIKSANY